VQVGDAPVGVDHREPGALPVAALDCRFDRGPALFGQLMKGLQQRREPVVWIDARLLKCVSMLGEDRLEVGADRVAEDDGVGDAHHRRLQMDREQDARALGVFELLGEEAPKGLPAHNRSVDHLARLAVELL
jgi:hypothetical protein